MLKKIFLLVHLFKDKVSDPELSALRSPLAYFVNQPEIGENVAREKMIIISRCVLRLGVDRIPLEDDLTIFMQQKWTAPQNLLFNCAKMQLKCSDLRRLCTPRPDFSLYSLAILGLAGPGGFPHTLNNI